MKAIVGIGIHQKPDMLGWLLSGIHEHFPGVRTLVHFEAVNDEMRKAWERELHSAPDWSMPITKTESEAHLLEHGVHRLLIERFMETDADCLIIPQDDNRFERTLLGDLEELWSKYGTELGWISGRDGHGYAYADMVCSPFSDSTGANKTALPIGEYREVMMMNTGPVVYFRHVIEKVGMPEPDMPWYWWTDYSLKCHHGGLKNILLSMDCKHEKFGRVGNNHDLYKWELVAKCLNRLNDTWGPILGRNPL